MATAEYAQLQTEQLQAEQVPALRFPHWAAVRWCAAVLYVVALAAYTAAYGIPVQRELVIAWTCGALAVASIGRPPREILQLVLDWAPIVAVLAVYDFTRGAADSIGIGVHFTTMIDFDQFVFFGETPTEWLQAHLYEPGVVHWYDVAFTLIYTSYFIVPFATAGGLWARDRLAFLRFAKRLVTLAIAGLATYIALPRRAALDGRRRRPARRHPPHHREGLGSGRTWHRRRCSPTARGRSTWSPPSPRCTPPSSPSSRFFLWGRVRPWVAAAAAALPAGDGPDPDRHRRALLLRRRCSAGSTRRR